MEISWTYLIAMGVIVLLVLWHAQRQFVKEKRARGKLAANREAGISEPVSLHPSLDPNRCVSIGACATACPEGEVIGMVNGHPVLIEPTKCIGHGVCAAACPVDAITLVFGTSERGVDIPHIRETFETNVGGVYIAGELGGMGLIRNAVTQGKQAVENVAKSRSKDNSVLDLVIVGAGPAGLAASLQAEAEGLRFVTIDQDDVGGTVLTYPRQKLVMTQPMEIPLHGKFNAREISKEELLDLWNEIIDRTGIKINTFERLEAITRPNGHFDVRTSATEYAARNVLLAIGRRGTPRKLGVPGEDSSKVTYKLLDPEQYKAKRSIVVGGGDSAIEAACRLAEQPDTDVTLSYRKSAFSRIKPGNQESIAKAVDAGRVRLMLESQVREIRPDSVVVEDAKGRHDIANDYAFVMIGGELPTPLLRSMGVAINTKFGEA